MVKDNFSTKRSLCREKKIKWKYSGGITYRRNTSKISQNLWTTRFRRYQDFIENQLYLLTDYISIDFSGRSRIHLVTVLRKYLGNSWFPKVYWDFPFYLCRIFWPCTNIAIHFIVMKFIFRNFFSFLSL